MNITDQAVIISGGASGLGAATAQLMDEQGAKVAILDMNIEAASKLAEEISGLAYEVDVTNAEAVEDAITDANQKHGVARVCICCAGIAPAQRIVGRDGPIPLENFSNVIDINLNGTFNVMRLAAHAMSTEEMLGEERGVIINTASVAAFDGQIGQAAYSASKGAITAMTLPAARELAQHAIRVNTIAPGIMATPMMMSMPDNVKQQLLAQAQFPKRFGDPREYASLVQQIITNPLLNGSVIRLDGALRMPPK